MSYTYIGKHVHVYYKTTVGCVFVPCLLMLVLMLLIDSIQDSNFTTALVLAVRSGKTLIIQEVDGVEPILYPLLRKDLVSQGQP